MKTKSFILAIALIVSVPSFAQNETLDYTKVVNSSSFVEFEEIDLDCSRDGKKIFGKIYKPKNAETNAVPMVIHCHGFNGGYGEPEPYAKALAKSGYGCVIFDFIGGSTYSKSEGETTEMSVFTEQKDTEEVLKVVRGLNWVNQKQIYLMGYSMGAVVSNLMAANHPEEIAGIIHVYPGLLMPEDARQRHPKEAYHSEKYNVMGVFLSHVFYDNLLDYDVFVDAKKYKGPVTLIYGTKDDMNRYGSMDKAKEAYTTTEFHLIQDGTHGFPVPEHKIETINWALDFFSKYAK